VFASIIGPCAILVIIMLTFLGYFALNAREETCWIVKLNDETDVADGVTWGEMRDEAMKEDYSTAKWFMELDSKERKVVTRLRGI